VNVYRPCSTDNTNSAYMVQYQYSLRFREGKCPRELLLIDLLHDIQIWKEKGDSIIIAGDFNEDIRLEVFNEWKKDAGLEDVFVERNVDNHILPPTFNRGINPIDIIMCTAGITVIKAGYLTFGEGVGDHRPLLMDVTVASTLGVKMAVPKKMVARRLKLQDPRVVKKYNKLLICFFRRFSILDQIQLLQDRVVGPLSDEEAANVEKMDAIRIRRMVYAEIFSEAKDGRNTVDPGAIKSNAGN